MLTHQNKFLVHGKISILVIYRKAILYNLLVDFAYKGGGGGAHLTLLRKQGL